MTVFVRLTKEEKRVAKAYAKQNGQSLSESMKASLFEKIEDEYDIALADSALRDYEQGHKSYTHEEVKKIFDC